jgi:hypothetical protein
MTFVLGGVMQVIRLRKLAGILAIAAFFSSSAIGATITGIVKGPDGMPYRAVFVRARSSKTGITVIVLSDSAGRYKLSH